MKGESFFASNVIHKESPGVSGDGLKRKDGLSCPLQLPSSRECNLLWAVCIRFSVLIFYLLSVAWSYDVSVGHLAVLSHRQGLCLD